MKTIQLIERIDTIDGSIYPSQNKAIYKINDTIKIDYLNGKKESLSPDYVIGVFYKTVEITEEENIKPWQLMVNIVHNPLPVCRRKKHTEDRIERTATDTKCDFILLLTLINICCLLVYVFFKTNK